MRYFKFTQISGETGRSWAFAQPVSGPSFPNLPGITNIIKLDHDSFYYVGEISGETDIPTIQEYQDAISYLADENNRPERTPDQPFIPEVPEDSPWRVAERTTNRYQNYVDNGNLCFEITSEEYAQELEKTVTFHINKRKATIYDEEKSFRQSIFSKYDETATIAGIYKYQEALELLADGNALAPQVRQEATIRGVLPSVMATRIKDNHESFRTKETKIAGIRGLIQDRLNNFVFDVNDAVGSYNEFYSLDIIATRTEMRPNPEAPGEQIETTVNITVPKYELALEQRFYQT